MTEFRRVTATFWVSPQIDLDDVARARAEGFSLIINNRPDGEGPGQPSGADIESAAKAAGLAYLSAPVVGMPGPSQVAAVRDAVDGASKTLAFCRSGTRSIVTWALGQARDGNREELARLAAEAGYDLGPILGV